MERTSRRRRPRLKQLTGQVMPVIAGRPVLEHEEDWVVTKLAKTWLRGPRRNDMDN